MTALLPVAWVGAAADARVRSARSRRRELAALTPARAASRLRLRQRLLVHPDVGVARAPVSPCAVRRGHRVGDGRARAPATAWRSSRRPSSGTRTSGPCSYELRRTYAGAPAASGAVRARHDSKRPCPGAGDGLVAAASSSGWRPVSRRSASARRSRAPSGSPSRGRSASTSAHRSARDGRELLQGPGRLMRILLIVHGYPPEAVGGTEIYTHDLAVALAPIRRRRVFRADPRSRSEPAGRIRAPRAAGGGHRRPHQQHVRVVPIVRGHLPQSGGPARGGARQSPRSSLTSPTSIT